MSRFPQINPISSGTNTAIRDLIGIFASPVAPRAISVKNGPSFSDRIEIAPVSVAFPNCEEREMYSDPFEFVIVAINTMVRFRGILLVRRSYQQRDQQ